MQAVLAHAVRRPLTSDEGRRVPLRDVRREPLRRDVGPLLRARRRQRVAQLAARIGPNMLNGRFRDLGAAPVRATGLLGGGDAVVWTATFGSRRSG